MDLTVEEWLGSAGAKMQELIAYGKSPLPREPGTRMVDMEKAIQYSSDAGHMLADAQEMLTHERAKAMYEILNGGTTYSAKEVEIIVKDKTREIQRIVDGMKVTQRSIHDRIYTNLNANRTIV